MKKFTVEYIWTEQHRAFQEISAKNLSDAKKRVLDTFDLDCCPTDLSFDQILDTEIVDIMEGEVGEKK